MGKLIEKPVIIDAQGSKPKTILEYVGRINTKSEDISIARMNSPEGWAEPGQTPEFDEFTLVLRGTLHVKTKSDAFDVHEGQAFAADRGEWLQYSSPYPGGAEYIAVCAPAFGPHLVHRDEE